ncbi:hypothetical protein C8N24_0264 [Solirubrobacter pauli]|uniref:Uncharacterized protein n=1 Tax=Solirubrobacter pauli TaxID=166793 RepID=A0A660LCP8_9ACTN|nr:hypothetical protein [Solirubrobacter pauli]RKQ90461.1 hypothetical protein C8N24_0264 [Solirubrobacter pauli]
MEPAVIVSLATGGIAALIGLHAGWVSRRALNVSKKTLAWQQKRDEERSETRLVVWFNHEARPILTEPAATVLLGCVSALPMDYWLTIVVYNAGETTDYISDLFMEDVKGLGRHVKQFQPDQAIRPRERVTSSFLLPGDPFDTAAGFIGRAVLAGGVVVESATEHLEPFLLEAVKARNSQGRLDAPPPEDEQMPDVTLLSPERPEPPQR